MAAFLIDEGKPYYNLFKEHKMAIIDNFETGFDKKRYSYPLLAEYMDKAKSGKICVLVGLRRTGKTIEMLQYANELSDKGMNVLFLSIAEPYEKDMMEHPEKLVQISDIYDIIDDAQKSGCQAIFIDELTYVNGFLYANLLANKYAMKTPIFVSGTDSLGFEIAGRDALYDRIVKIPTSYIPFDEFHHLLPGKSLDDYIKFGGTLHDESPYKERQSAEEYMNTAIAGNIIHALKFDEIDRNYDALTDLYKANDLKGAIQKLANKAGQNIAIRSIRKEYESAPIRTALKNLSKENAEPDFDLALAKKSESLKNIENELREIFEIRLNSELAKGFRDEDFKELKRYLYEIGLLRQIPVYMELSDKSISESDPKEILLQPGMLYCHAQEALKSLTFHEKVFDDWNIGNRAAFMDRLDRQVKGDILESIILFDTYEAFPKMRNANDMHGYYVSKLRLENVIWHDVNLTGNEIDMIIRTPESMDIYLFEVKYSTEKVSKQKRHLENDIFLDYIEEQFSGKIKGRAVIYNGPMDMSDDIKYINATDYLNKIKTLDKIEDLFISIKKEGGSEGIKRPDINDDFSEH